MGASHDSSTEMTETLVGPEDLVDLVGRRCLHARALTIRPVIPGFLACRLVEERLSAVRAAALVTQRLELETLSDGLHLL